MSLQYLCIDILEKQMIEGDAYRGIALSLVGAAGDNDTFSSQGPLQWHSSIDE